MTVEGMMTVDGDRIDLRDQVAVITGAAGGLGAAYARECAARGARLFLTDVNGKALEPFAAELARTLGESGAVRFAAGDIADPAFADRVADECGRHFGALTGWVNNAGVEVRQPADSADAAAVAKMVSVNLVGTILGTAAAARAMTTGGSIVNVTSGAQFGLRNLSVYGATKGGIASFTYGAALDLADRGIRVNAISPLARTRMSANGDQHVAGTVTRARPEACAGLVSYLLSASSRQLTGQILRLDGQTLSVVRRSEIDTRSAVTRPDWPAEAIAAAVAGPLAPALAVTPFRSPVLGD